MGSECFDRLQDFLGNLVKEPWAPGFDVATADAIMALGRCVADLYSRLDAPACEAAPPPADTPRQRAKRALIEAIEAYDEAWGLAIAPLRQFGDAASALPELEAAKATNKAVLDAWRLFDDIACGEAASAMAMHEQPANRKGGA